MFPPLSASAKFWKVAPNSTRSKRPTATDPSWDHWLSGSARRPFSNPAPEMSTRSSKLIPNPEYVPVMAMCGSVVAAGTLKNPDPYRSVLGILVPCPCRG